jgi:hypothetical protein
MPGRAKVWDGLLTPSDSGRDDFLTHFLDSPVLLEFNDKTEPTVLIEMVDLGMTRGRMTTFHVVAV